MRASPPLTSTRCASASSPERRLPAVAPLVGQGAAHDRGHVLVAERLEAHDPRARQERRVDLVVGVLGGRPDERDGARLDVRQEGVLLALVEAVDLVDEEDRRRAAGRRPLGRAGDQRAHVGHAAHDRAEGLETGAGGVGQEARQGGLAHARRAPQDHRREVPAAQLAGQRALLADEVTLAHDLGQGARPHARGQRGVMVGRGLEQAPADWRSTALRRPGIGCSLRRRCAHCRTHPGRRSDGR